jgi:hypothetical protein
LKTVLTRDERQMAEGEPVWERFRADRRAVFGAAVYGEFFALAVAGNLPFEHLAEIESATTRLGREGLLGASLATLAA